MKRLTLSGTTPGLVQTKLETVEVVYHIPHVSSFLLPLGLTVH